MSNWKIFRDSALSAVITVATYSTFAILFLAFTGGDGDIDRSDFFGAVYFSAINDGSGTYPLHFGISNYSNFFALYTVVAVLFFLLLFTIRRLIMSPEKSASM
ncbi:hypothetical protein [Corynebacterium parakroppenstedtii]|uniref:hypothetical protein n=1 Tax=Corynebacterium parakroppenstedtii TaxID=2828363 RepID=UPI001C8DE5C5|nr:hypothetical protein [Corynebacterium parakroppenstedtii]MBY0788253.1 hypothetical protein [Corynebacterium parakroppenstedtii]